MADTAAVSKVVNRRTRFQTWFPLFQGSEVLPIIPPTAKLDPDSKVDEKNRGKTPGKLGPNGWVGFGGSWANDFRAELDDVKQWHAWGASVGLQTRIFHAVDIDVDLDDVADDIEAECLKLIGDAPVRYRKGSGRRLLLYRIKDGETPMRKRRIAFMVAGNKCAVELLAYGQQCVVEGPHPKGGEYIWRNRHPCERKPNGIPEITKDKADAFFAFVGDYCDMMGHEVVKTSGATSGAGTRTGLDNPALWAKSPQDVLDVLKVWHPEHMDHDEYVQAIAAIKASLGPDREQYRAEVLEWSPGVRSTEDDEFAKRWDSVNDSALGWSWLAAQAKKVGYSTAAQSFADDAPAGSLPVDPNAGIPETALEKMIEQYVFVKGLGQYNDTHDGSFLSGRDFNAANVDVADFGRTGVQSAEAQFQNHPQARKVATATSRPGEPLIVQEANDRGIKVEAVNLWRPSLVKPDLAATAVDVEPWLDLVNLIFGDGSPEREHLLDWWAFVLQRPGLKIGHAPVIIGGQGVGKDTVLKPLFEAVGIHNVASIDTATLFGPWTYFLKSPIIYAQEMITYGRRDLYNTLKPFISAQATRLPVNEKNMRQYFVPNNQNWIVTSNHDNAIALEDDDRRFWIHSALIEEPPPSQYFAKLHAWLKTGGTEKVFGWLKQRDLSGFDPMAKPPITAAKRTMLEQSQPAPVRWLRRLFAEGGDFAGRSVIVIGELLRTDDFSAPVGINSKSAASALKAEGFTQGPRVKINGDARQLWMRDTFGASKAQSAEQLRQRYLAETNRNGEGCKIGER